MRECRFFPWCSYIEDHGCTKDSCRHYQPMPDVKALLALADELEEDACWEVQTPGDTSGAWRLKDACDRIREALGVVA